MRLTPLEGSARMLAMADAPPGFAQPPQRRTEPFMRFRRGPLSQRRLEVNTGRLPIACSQGCSTTFDLVCAHAVRVLRAVRLRPRRRLPTGPEMRQLPHDLGASGKEGLGRPAEEWRER